MCTACLSQNEEYGNNIAMLLLQHAYCFTFIVKTLQHTTESKTKKKR